MARKKKVENEPENLGQEAESKSDPREVNFKEDKPHKNMSARKSYGEILRENNEKRKARILKMRKEKEEESE